MKRNKRTNPLLDNMQKLSACKAANNFLQILFYVEDKKFKKELLSLVKQKDDMKIYGLIKQLEIVVTKLDWSK